jgi:Ca2+-binding EF-hand superfamily protein
MLREMEEETRLNETQILSLYHQFRKLAPKGSLSIDGFRQAMGCLGFLDNSFLSNRLFTVFDTSGNNLVQFVFVLLHLYKRDLFICKRFLLYICSLVLLNSL